MHFKERNIHTTKTKGSFLIELLVAFTIISLSLTVVVDSFVSSQHAYYTTSDKADLTSALAFLMEDMTREARVSDNFRCGDASTPCINFHMDHIEGLNGAGAGETIIYEWVDNDTIEKTDDGTGPFIMNEKTKVIIDSFEVEILGNPPIDPLRAEPLRARVSMSAHSVDSPDNVIHLQTSFTARSY